jgi:hypothetical protein
LSWHFGQDVAVPGLQFLGTLPQGFIDRNHTLLNRLIETIELRPLHLIEFCLQRDQSRQPRAALSAASAISLMARERLFSRSTAAWRSADSN